MEHQFIQVLMQDAAKHSVLENAYNVYVQQVLNRQANQSWEEFHNCLVMEKTELTALCGTFSRKTLRYVFWLKGITVVNAQLRLVDNCIAMQNGNGVKYLSFLHWTRSKIELVELLYALTWTHCFGKATLKEVFEVFGAILHCPITDYSRQLGDIERRKDHRRTKFLDVLQNIFLSKMKNR